MLKYRLMDPAFLMNLIFYFQYFYFQNSNQNLEQWALQIIRAMLIRDGGDLHLLDMTRGCMLRGYFA